MGKDALLIVLIKPDTGADAIDKYTSAARIAFAHDAGTAPVWVRWDPNGSLPLGSPSSTYANRVATGSGCAVSLG